MNQTRLRTRHRPVLAQNPPGHQTSLTPFPKIPVRLHVPSSPFIVDQIEAVHTYRSRYKPAVDPLKFMEQQYEALEQQNETWNTRFMDQVNSTGQGYMGLWDPLYLRLKRALILRPFLELKDLLEIRNHLASRD